MLSRGLCSTAAQKPPWGKVTPTAGQGQPRKSQLLTRGPFIFSDSVPGTASGSGRGSKLEKLTVLAENPHFLQVFSLCLSA